MIDIEDLSFPIDEYKVMQLSATSSSVDRYVITYTSCKKYREYVEDRIRAYDLGCTTRPFIDEWQFLTDCNKKNISYSTKCLKN